MRVMKVGLRKHIAAGDIAVHSSVNEEEGGMYMYHDVYVCMYV